MVNKVLFSSKSDEWETPQGLFNELDEEFNFDRDPCATPENAKCGQYYTKEDDGLRWSYRKESVFINPPYSQISKWVEKAYNESRDAKIIVMLLPARTDTRWFHKYIYNKAKIRFIKGRLKFGDSKNSAPFPSMIVIFNKEKINAKRSYIR